MERVTDRQRTLVSGSKFQDLRVAVQTEIVHDTVFVQKTDSVYVSNTNGTDPTNARASPVASVLKWVFYILIGLIALTITVKVCTLRR